MKPEDRKRLDRQEDDKLNALRDQIRRKIPPEVDWYARKISLQHVSEPELVVLLLLTFFAGCENHGTLYMDGWAGYTLSDYMRQAGIVNCAEVFLKLHPLVLANEELDEMEELSEDDYADKLDVIQGQMQQIEREMPSESFDEIRLLLWRFAQKHSLDKILQSP